MPHCTVLKSINQPTLASRTALAGAALFAMPLAFTLCHPRLGHFPAAAIMQSAGAFGAHVTIKAVAAHAAALLFLLGFTKYVKALASLADGASASTSSVGVTTELPRRQQH
jgi:hypothetical protein